MKAAQFAYHRPDTVAEAVQMLGEFGDDAKILAGGQSLVPMLAMRLTHFEHLVDISRVDELKNIELRDDELWIAAGTTHALVGMDDEVADSVPLLTLSTPYIGHFQIRTRGTLGGAIAHADPAAEYAAVALALDATIEATSSRGRREIPAGEFFTGLWETALAPDEILTGVRFPVWGARSGFAVQEFARRHGDFAIAGATVAVQLDGDGRVARCGIGLLGLGSTPLRGSVAEDAVVGRPADTVTAEELGRLAMSGLSEIPADLAGSGDYRSRVGATMVARAWAAAVRQAQTSEREIIHA
jgi:carbon-monoxide dehydrogenase medium subunit